MRKLFGDSPDATVLTGAERLAGLQGGAHANIGLAIVKNWIRGWFVVADVSDSTGTGRALMTAADAFAARSAIGAGTSSLVIGSTAGTAKAGDYAPSKADLGLENVANLAPADLPVSTAQLAALNLKAPLASPTFTGTPLVPTAATSVNTTQAASTAFVWSWAGTYGLGTTSIPTTADANTVTRASMVKLTTAGTNGPTAATAYNILHMATAGSGAQSQLATSVNAGTLGRTFVRAWATGTGAGVAWNELAAVSFANTWTAQQTYSLPVKLAQYTLTTLPSAATYSGGYITVTNATGGAKLCYSTGTAWVIAGTTTTVS